MESKKYGWTGFGFLRGDGFTGQGNQIGNNLISNMNEMDSKWVKGHLKILQHIQKRELELLLININ